jgi:predicted P-loop ATPase
MPGVSGSSAVRRVLPARSRVVCTVRVVGVIDVEGIERDGDQLGAEALACFESSEPWHVDTSELRAARPL